MMKQSVMLAQLNEQVEYLRGLLEGLDGAHLAKPPAPGKMSLKHQPNVRSTRRADA